MTLFVFTGNATGNDKYKYANIYIHIYVYAYMYTYLQCYMWRQMYITCTDMQCMCDLNQKAGGGDWGEGAAPHPKAE